MDREERDILQGLGLAAVALASAALTATLVISLGSTLVQDADAASVAPPDTYSGLLTVQN